MIYAILLLLTLAGPMDYPPACVWHSPAKVAHACRVSFWSSMMKEEWRDVPGYEGIYQASNCGLVRSLSRMTNAANQWGPMKRFRSGKVLKGSPNSEGYIIVEFVGNTRFGIHRLILLTFVGPCPPKMYARHLDGDPANNHLSNLCWDTPTNNNQDKIRHGTITCGERVNTAKLSPDQVREIRLILRAPLSQGRQRREWGLIPKLTSKYGVSSPTLYRIASGKSWKCVE